MANRTVVVSHFNKFYTLNCDNSRGYQLVTHHIELVLPAAHYLVRLGPDGRIDKQGSIEDLRAQGVLEVIAKVSEVEGEVVEEPLKPGQVADAAIGDTNPTGLISKVTTVKSHKIRHKLVKEEARATGRVGWTIYKTYLEASYVRHPFTTHGYLICIIFS